VIGKLGLPELLVIAAVVMLVFGPSRLPKLAKSLGDSIREFRNVKNAFHEGVNELKDAKSSIESEIRK
jgi:sec-independent protein translocase protein TatA